MRANDQRVKAISLLREVADRWEHGNLSWPFRKQVELFLAEITPPAPNCGWRSSPAKRADDGRRWRRTCGSVACRERATTMWRASNGPTRKQR